MINDKDGNHYIGIDVGTGSARAFVIDHKGNIVGLASQDIKTWQPHPEYYEQSTVNIWDSICAAVKQAVQQCGVPSSNIRGLAFDATCSLAVFSKDTDDPVSVSGSELSDDRNVILWLDHRAVDETKTINATGHPVLQYIGGGMSPEMEMPKILWLKKHMNPGKFHDCKFYDLADALTHLATGKETRSYCSVVCKQGYLATGIDCGEEGWQLDFLISTGLEDLATDDFVRLGGINGKKGQYLSAGECVGPLGEKAAADLGLSPGIAVGRGVIDAYAGWIGTVGAKVDLGLDSSADQKEHLSHRLAVVAGTSTCHLAMSNDELFVPRIWGPYRDVLFPVAYLAEGGQSATGELIRHIVESHPAYSEQRRQRRRPASIFTTSLTTTFAKKPSKPRVYRTATRQIVDTMNEHGHQISTIFMSGSQTQNDLLVHLIASVCRVPVVLPEYVHAAVCHGAAMLAAMAASGGPGPKSKDLWGIMGQMSKPGRRVDTTTNTHEQGLLEAKYEVFLDMCFKQREYRELVDKRLNTAE
ncbi:hypothetical protein N7474_006861 [Penicillium riverlandense]|uniref:uncharacterized protein n=1 Tax=Penicillium riverlandense TaxID=1903569 RepID=UPI002549813D|nr:uncharacterized protein N7474_006861 [Penicillium riverlandense]KAJ5815084.1 hypothetical protein N7474_006861 [Penicillium riverlandense]